MLDLSLADLRENYKRDSLDEASCDSNPIRQFGKWFVEAKAAKLKEPNAMCLATATPDGKPSGRIVLLKEIDETGFVFYTNYRSRKGQELVRNPTAALIFFWAELERQVRVEGTVQIVDRDQSERYFAGRPKGSKVGAWVSRQSEVVGGRKPIEQLFDDLEKQYAETDEVPTPEFWGGFRVVPDELEFWQGRPNRLHDRIRYRRQEPGAWMIERLWP